MKLLNAGCGTYRRDGWVNCDVWSSETTSPDVLVTPGSPYPFPDNHFDAIYLGHVIEHMPWDAVPAFLSDMRRVARPEAPILIVGPDIYKTIRLWAEGRQPWHMIEQTLEHLDRHHQPGRLDEDWEAAYHYWNCHLDRVVTLLTSCGFERVEPVCDEIPDDPAGRWWFDKDSGILWPVVGKNEWQFAVRTFA